MYSMEPQGTKEGVIKALSEMFHENVPKKRRPR